MLIELAEINARLNVLYERFDTPSEKPGDVHDHHALMRRYTETAARLSICNTPGCLNPKQPDAPWCVRESDRARQILVELLAEQASAD